MQTQVQADGLDIDIFGLLFFAAIFAVLMGMPAVVIGLVFYLDSLRRKVCKRALEQISQRLGGSVEEYGFGSLPALRLQIQNYPALLSYRRVSKHSTFTQLAIAWPETQLQCEVYHHHVLGHLGDLFGGQDIEIGSPEFDATYRIRGNHPNMIRTLLTDSVQRQITQSFPIRLAWSGGTLTILRPRFLNSSAGLQEFVSQALELFNNLITQCQPPQVTHGS